MAAGGHGYVGHIVRVCFPGFHRPRNRRHSHLRRNPSNTTNSQNDRESLRWFVDRDDKDYVALECGQVIGPQAVDSLHRQWVTVLTEADLQQSPSRPFSVWRHQHAAGRRLQAGR